MFDNGNASHNLPKGGNIQAIKLVGAAGASVGKDKTREFKKKELRRNINHFLRIARFIVTRTIWLNVFRYIVVPLSALAAIHYYDISLQSKTFYLSAAYYHLSMLAITAGYHRYWTHRAYSIDSSYNFLPMFFVVFGSSVGIESAKRFRSIHKLHHKYCDSDKDPHNYRKNFMWAHIGWKLVRNRKLLRLLNEKEEEENANSDESLDGNNSPLNICSEVSANETIAIDKYVDWQDKNNFQLYVLFGVIAPCLIAGYFWNDFVGGFIYAGLLRSAVVQQSLFTINSLGHLIGSQPFGDKKTVRDSFVVSLITYGEGYNNFHHLFPNDYRGGYLYYRFDPTKWFLNFCFRFQIIFGVKSLRSTNTDIIKRSVVLHQQRVIDRHRAKLNWGVPVNKLPLITVDEFKKLSARSGRALTIISGVVHDVTPFVHNHPGGVALIKSAIGKDATSAFNGAVYSHSNAANNLLATMRVALIRDKNTNSVIRQNRTTTRTNTIFSNAPLETADAA